MAIRLTEPTTDQIIKDTYNRGMTKVVKVPLELDTTYALCLIKLGPAVTSDNYPALKNAIEAISGIQEIQLIIDHHTRTTIPSGTQLISINEFNLRIDDINN